MTLLGILIFVLVGHYFRLDTGLDLVYIYLQYPFLCAASYIAGPISGCIIGLLGHFFVALMRGDTIWYTWIVASSLIGGATGILFRKFRLTKREEYPDGKRLLAFSLICVVCFFVVMGLLVPLANALFYQVPLDTAFQQGLFAAASDTLTTIIVGSILISSLNHTRIRWVLALIAMLDSLLLLSYGNKGIGSLIVYGITLFLCISFFLHAVITHFASKGFLRGLRFTLIGIGGGILTLFAFLFCSAHLGAANGEEQIVIILGAGLNDTKPGTALSKRLEIAVEHLQSNPDSIVICSGGQGADEVISEAEAMRRYLVEHGIDSTRIYLEDHSTTTEENFNFSYRLANSLGYPDDTMVAYATNDFHCFRSGCIARDAGFTNVAPIPCPTSLMTVPVNYIRELLAIGNYILHKIF